MKTPTKKVKRVKVKVWTVLCDSSYRPMKEDFGMMYSTKKQALKDLGKCDYIIPCEVIYSITSSKGKRTK